MGKARRRRRQDVFGTEGGGAAPAAAGHHGPVRTRPDPAPPHTHHITQTLSHTLTDSICLRWQGAGGAALPLGSACLHGRGVAAIVPPSHPLPSPLGGTRRTIVWTSALALTVLPAALASGLAGSSTCNRYGQATPRGATGLCPTRSLCSQTGGPRPRSKTRRPGRSSRVWTTTSWKRTVGGERKQPSPRPHSHPVLSPHCSPHCILQIQGDLPLPAVFFHQSEGAAPAHHPGFQRARPRMPCAPHG